MCDCRKLKKQLLDFQKRYNESLAETKEAESRGYDKAVQLLQDNKAVWPLIVSPDALGAWLLQIKKDILK